MRNFLKLTAIGLSAAAAGFSAINAGAVQGASLGSPGLSSPLSLPAAFPPTVAPLAVVSEMPFQIFADLTCSGDPSTCRRKLGPVLAKERWIVQFVSCNAVMAEPGKLRNFALAVTDTALTKLFGGHYISPTYQSSGSLIHYVASQPMLLTVGAGAVLHVETASYSGGITGAACGLTGVRQKLG
jgi:hypothetical protein